MPMQGPSEYTLEVEGVGVFTFAKRTMRLEIAIGVESQRLSEGLELHGPLSVFVDSVAMLKTLTRAAPEGWDVDGADPYDPDVYERILKVREALLEREGGFRKEPDAAP